MGEIRVYNTLTNKKEPLIPIIPGQIGMYVCGVTVYDRCHIGHARGAIVFDTIRRYLSYRGFKVTYIRNFTDVDDKIINRARQEGCLPGEVAEKYTKEYCKDMQSLGVAPADLEPRATEHIAEIIDLIKGLVEKGIAYQVEGDVFFEISKFSDYGKLSKQDLESMRAGARVDIDTRKKDPLDFALWKGAKEGEPAWASPWGMGRPGWHIECSAMSMKHLGESFDIHGGGKDLIFPHHENEIAQSEAFTGKPLARYWLHNGFVNIDQEKMSKSLGNFFTIQEVLAKYPSEALRLFLLSTHYRSPINFSLQGVEEAKTGLERIYNSFYNVDYLLAASHQPGAGEGDLPQEFQDRLRNLTIGFEEAMDDDFNTAEAIARVYEAVKDINILVKEIREYKGQPGVTLLKVWQRDFLQAMTAKIRQLGQILGLFKVRESGYQTGGDQIINDLMDIILEIRGICRSKKDWSLSDLIRSRLTQKGITVEDRPEGSIWRIKR